MTLRRLNMCAELINHHFKDYSLLDIGCRTMDLKPLLHYCADYYGTDRIHAEGVFACNLEEGLPSFEDNSFDIVVGLDVIEHLENAHGTFRDILRVAKKAVFVSLPNMYYIIFRYNFLIGKGISGKYAFPPQPILDRHRWILSYTESLAFIHKNASEYDIETRMILPERGRTKLISEPIEKWLGKTWPDLFAYGSLFMIRPKSKP